MSVDKAKQFLNALNGKGARDAWKAKMAGTKSDEEAVEAAVGLAREMGYDVTGEDINEAMNALKSELMEKTEKAVEGLQEMDDDSLEDVAGGEVFWVNEISKKVKKNYGCKFNFTDDDCYLEDACEILSIVYNGSEKTYFKEACIWEKDCFFREYAGD